MPIQITNSKGDTKDLGAGFARGGRNMSWRKRRQTSAGAVFNKAQHRETHKAARSIRGSAYLATLEKAGIKLTDLRICPSCKRKRIYKNVYARQMQMGILPTCMACARKADEREERIERVLRKPLTELTARDRTYLQRVL